jgi:hypothetical protein
MQAISFSASLGQRVSVRANAAAPARRTAPVSITAKQVNSSRDYQFLLARRRDLFFSIAIRRRWGGRRACRLAAYSRGGEGGPTQPTTRGYIEWSGLLGYGGSASSPFTRRVYGMATSSLSGCVGNEGFRRRAVVAWENERVGDCGDGGRIRPSLSLSFRSHAPCRQPASLNDGAWVSALRAPSKPPARLCRVASHPVPL